MTVRSPLYAFVANVCFAAGSAAYAQTLPPPVDMKLAHDIYKEFIEIQSGFTRARRLRSPRQRPRA